MDVNDSPIVRGECNLPNNGCHGTTGLDANSKPMAPGQQKFPKTALGQ